MGESPEPGLERAPEASGKLTIEEFCELLRSIEKEIGTRHSKRQASRDAFEAMRDGLVDRYLAGNLPAKPWGWSQMVLAHLLLEHNSHWIQLVGQRFEGEALSQDHEISRVTVTREELAVWRDSLEQMSADLDPLLTPVERRVFASTKKFSTMAEIAGDCGMTARDIRNRLRRIVAKGKKVARSRPPPPSWGWGRHWGRAL